MSKDLEKTRKLISATVNSLSHSQGFYGRLREQIGENAENLTDEQLEQFADCHDSLDVVLKLEQ